jgi:hypothetical protein
VGGGRRGGNKSECESDEDKAHSWVLSAGSGGRFRSCLRRCINILAWPEKSQGQVPADDGRYHFPAGGSQRQPYPERAGFLQGLSAEIQKNQAQSSTHHIGISERNTSIR